MIFYAQNVKSTITYKRLRREGFRAEKTDVRLYTLLTVYDSSFIVGKTGQVVGVNDEETDDNILKMFKRYSWITMSQLYPLLSFGAEQNVDGVAELNYTDLKSKIDDFNKRLVPIATGVNEGSTEELSVMQKESKESFGILAGYLKSITDDKERELFNALTRDYHSFVESISVLLSKRTSPTKPANTIIQSRDTQYCFNCKQEKDPSHFSSPNATICIECEEDEQREARKTKKQCVKCGKYKSINQFSNGGDVCKECQEQDATQTKTCRHCGKEKPLSDFPLNSDTCKECSHTTNLYPMLGVVALFAIVGCLYWYITSDSDKDSKTTGEPKTEIVEKREGEKTEENKVSVDTLNQYLANGDFTEACQYISDKQDKANYRVDIANAIDNHFWSIIESSETTEFEGIKSQLELEIRPISSLLTEVGLGDGYTERLLQGAKSFARLQTIITKLNITEAEHNEGLNILSSIGGKLTNNWQVALDTKWEATKVLAQKKEAKTETKGEVEKTSTSGITIKRFDSHGVLLDSVNITNDNIGVEGIVNSFMEIDGHGTSITFGNDCPFEPNRIKNILRVRLTKVGKYTYKCGTKNITITAKAAAKKYKRH